MPCASTLPSVGHRSPLCLRGLRILALLPLLGGSALVSRAESGEIPSAAHERVETGAPSFAVLGAETIGLSAPPSDLQFLPDGRLLAITQRELAFGDGVRWQVFRAADDTGSIFGRVAVDARGTIYFGVEGGIARVELGTDARWRAVRVTDLPAAAGIETTTMVAVSRLTTGWYWHGGSGAIVTWQPDETPRVAGNISSIECIFSVDQDLFVSEQASGGLYRLTSRQAGAERVTSSERFASETITCTVPFAPGVVLAGTSFNGLQLFDGVQLRPFGQPGLLNSFRRINDVCAAGNGWFAAAVDTVGVVFFDRTGRVVQVLERSLDHRLGRVQRILYASNGVLWMLLNEGVARVEFPSPVSRFDPLIASGLAYAKPVRHKGDLWLLADGRAMRGVYDPAGRLERFEPDLPAGRYVFSLTVVADELYVANDRGIFLRRQGTWDLIAGGIVNGRVLRTLPGERLLYAGRDEIGTLTRTQDGYAVQSQRVPQLGDVYNAIEEASGILWFELGTSRVARVDLRTGEPAVEIFGPKEGLTDGWVEAYVLDGVARFHLPNHLFRFDERARRFVADEELMARYPELLTGGGRPSKDATGRMWYTANGTAQIMDTGAPPGGHRSQVLPVGFAPSEYTLDENGTAWLFLNRRLARVDLRVAPPAPTPPRAIVTAVQFTASDRHLFAPGGELSPINYADNSLVFHYAAPANPFGPAVSFEVLLEGAGTQWISTGNVGSATFNRLKEGRYVFHVRPVLAGQEPGTAARIAFTVRPPWFRTPAAWGVYVVSAIGLLGGSIWLPAFLQRRENERLERLVSMRTDELNTTNLRLARQIAETTEKSTALTASEERYRLLNAELERRVQERTAQLSLSNEELAQRESLFRLIFEHAPVGISWKRSDLGDMHHFNPTFRRILGLPLESSHGYSVLEKLLHPDDVARHQSMQRLIDAGEQDSYNLELRFVHREGAVVWASMSVAVIRDKSGRIVQDIGILEDITARKQAEQELAKTYKNLVDASRMAGMAEVATGVLHNVGNVLNSLNVSGNLIANAIRQTKVDSLVKLSALVNERASHLGEFLTQDPKGKLVPEMLAQLAAHGSAERDWLAKEVSSMQRNIDHIKEIVAMQQSYATVLGVVETLEPSTLFEDALRMNTAALMRHDVTVIREFLPTPKVSVEKGKVLQILINLIRNAKYACDDAHLPEGSQKVMTVRVEPGEDNHVRLIVRDNGVGIAPENLTRIFAHGFTTRAYGHGFGLHSSALAAKDMKGSLTAHSEGLGHGATFVLEIPAEPAATGDSQPS